MKPKKLGLGDKSTISGDPQDMGLNERSGIDEKSKLRGETGSGQPEIKKQSISSDRGKFKCR
jgi:hypothetical protein